MLEFLVPNTPALLNNPLDKDEKYRDPPLDLEPEEPPITRTAHILPDAAALDCTDISPTTLLLPDPMVMDTDPPLFDVDGSVFSVPSFALQVGMITSLLFWLIWLPSETMMTLTTDLNRSG